MAPYEEKEWGPWRTRLHEVIFEADTTAGKAFDVALLWTILFSVIAVFLESVNEYEARFGGALKGVEWFFTILFTIEYVLRIISVRRPLRYIFSYYGLVDLLAVLPTYISLVASGSQYLMVIRILRLVRVFRIFKLARYLGEGRQLMLALKASRPKITVFLVTVLSMVTIIGSLMYLIEGEQNGFTSIPKSIYWAIVTLTTVGYGDIAPKTSLGQLFAALVMILGYGIIAVPTGIVTAELTHARGAKHVTTQACAACSAEGHDQDAEFCKYCGARL